MMKTITNMRPDDVRGKTVLLRCDLNVPVQTGNVLDTTRITQILPTVNYLCEGGAKVVLISHFGRPKGVDLTYSLEFLMPYLSDVLGRAICWLGHATMPQLAERIKTMQMGQVGCLENIRFYPEEELNDPIFAQSLAGLGDIYVNDGFSVCHRAHASTHGIAYHMPSYAGFALAQEIHHLESAFQPDQTPILVIVGGAKISTKIGLLRHIVTKVQTLVVAGGIANTFLQAQGIDVADSLVESGCNGMVKDIFDIAKDYGCTVITPCDVVTTVSLQSPFAEVCDVHAIPKEHKIVDMGPRSLGILDDILHHTKTVIWNGALGVFEIPPFDRGTMHLTRSIATQTNQGNIISIAGGGETLAAIHMAGCSQDFTHVSTAGGAFLEWLEGFDLPGIHALNQNEQGI